MAHSARYGIALDIGTSKLEGVLVDLSSLKTISSSSSVNSQELFGRDVISRLNYAISKDAGLEKLNREVVSSVDTVISALVSKASISEDVVSRIICVGNSAMHHLLLSLPPEALAKAPFKPLHIKETYRGKAGGLGLKRCPETDLEFLPNLGGFVGSDALAVIISSGMYKSKAPVLAVDIGTNGEVILGNKDRILAASTSAGPAFEGWHISCGMPAIDGAIEFVEIKQDGLVFKTIGARRRPKGVCGSGLIDLIRCLLSLAILDETGRLKGGKVKLSAGLYITQEDIRELQLAKAAIMAAIAILQRKFNLEVVIDNVFLTGRFGSRIQTANAQAIGIIPAAVDLKKVVVAPNGALEGARLILSSNELEKKALGLYNKISHVELHKERDFQDEFVRATRF